MKTRVYFGANLYRPAMAMDEAPPAREKEREDDEDGPSFSELGAAVDEAAEALDAIRGHLKRGGADTEGRLSFDAVRRRIADARDCMDTLEAHLGGAGGGEDEEPGETDREEAHARARDGEVDHRRDFDPIRGGSDGISGDSARSRRRQHMAQDRRRGVPDIDLEAIFPRTTRPEGGAGSRGVSSSLEDIFAP
ncbi:MAG: hypothetical protein ACRETP_01480 [Steroidobacteraceae bacterium]